MSIALLSLLFLCICSWHMMATNICGGGGSDKHTTFHSTLPLKRTIRVRAIWGEREEQHIGAGLCQTKSLSAAAQLQDWMTDTFEKGERGRGAEERKGRPTTLREGLPCTMILALLHAIWPHSTFATIPYDSKGFYRLFQWYTNRVSFDKRLKREYKVTVAFDIGPPTWWSKPPKASESTEVQPKSPWRRRWVAALGKGMR